MGQRPTGHQNQHTTAHALIKATIKYIWDREDLTICEKIKKIKKFVEKFTGIDIAKDEQVLKLEKDIELLKNFKTDKGTVEALFD